MLLPWQVMDLIAKASNGGASDAEVQHWEEGVGGEARSQSCPPSSIPSHQCCRDRATVPSR